jgi:hypothetical protein
VALLEGGIDPLGKGRVRDAREVRVHGATCPRKLAVR